MVGGVALHPDGRFLLLFIIYYYCYGIINNIPWSVVHAIGIVELIILL